MPRIQHISLTRKLVTLILIITGVALLLACAGFVARDVVTFRKLIRQDLMARAELVARSTTTPLTLNNPALANEILNTLNADPHLLNATVFRSDGSMLAAYIRRDLRDAKPKLNLHTEGFGFENNLLWVACPVRSADGVLGRVVLQTDLGALRSRINKYVEIAALVFVLSFAVAILLSTQLQQFISRPVLALAQTADEVATRKDYSIRAIKRSHDEIGHLVDRFNEMLTQIESRDAALHKAHDELEQRVTERTEELSRANTALQAEMTERQRAEEVLRQVQKMEAVGQLAAGIAHDYNNILTVIQGHIELLLQTRGHDTELKESLTQVATAATRAANLTRQLLAFSRRQVMQPRSLEINEVVSNLVKMLSRILGEHIALELRLHPALPKIHADIGMIEQVLTNLAVNARDAMPDGGNLTISTQFAVLDEAAAKKHPLARAGSFVCLRVADSGCGMDRATLARIFEPFFTTKSVGKGTGLGLATVYGIVQQHQGWIEVKSQPGSGSEFVVYLPESNEVISSSETEFLTGPVRGGDETILVVEDEPSVRALACAILSSNGYKILEAGDGPEALRIWEKQGGKIDLVLTDLVMPGGLTGRELARQLKTIQPDVKIIYTSGYSLEVAGRDLALEPDFHFLPKPYHPPSLLRAIRNRIEMRKLK